jgi:hypothetical protein
MGRRLSHPPGRTRRAKATPLATEGQQQLFRARVTAQAEKAMGENTTPQIVIKFTFHINLLYLL